MTNESLIPAALYGPLTEMLSIYSEFLGITRDVISKSQISDPKLANFSIAQLGYFSERCQSSNLLWQQAKYWDCEIVMRSALECATRFIYVCIADKEQRETRIEEFDNSLWEIDTLNASEKARAAVEANSGSDSVDVLIGGVILPEKEEAILRQKWPRKRRKELAQKWSFSEMAREISSFKRDDVDLRNYPSLLHSYSVSSHLIHADSTAISLVWDQNTRQKDEAKLKANSHATRLLSDQLTFMFLSTRVLMMAADVPPDLALLEATKRAMVFYKLVEPFHATFLESQRYRYHV